MKETQNRQIYKKFEDLYNSYCNSLGNSTITSEERKSKCLSFVSLNNSEYNEGYAYYAYSLKTGRTFWFKDAENLWESSRGRQFTKGEILDKTHPTNKFIVSHLLHGLFYIFGKNQNYREDLYNKKYFFRIGRGFIEEGTDQYWWVVQTIFPLEFDENKKVVSYLSKIMIEDKYRDDTPFVNIVPNFSVPKPKSTKVLEEFQNHRQTILDLLGFSKREKEIILLIAQNIKNKVKVNVSDFALKFGSEKNTINAQFREIRNKGNTHFQNIRFKSTIDLVIFLIKGDFII